MVMSHTHKYLPRIRVWRLRTGLKSRSNVTGALVCVVQPQCVGDEDAIELGVFQKLCEFDPVVEIIVGGLPIGMSPES